MELIIALAQLEVATGDFARNTARAADFIQRARQADADLIVFPELWTAGFDYTDRPSYSRSNLRYLMELQAVSDDSNLAIGGSYLIEEEGQFFNRFVLLQPRLPRLTYDKIHLFGLMDEDKNMARGGRVSLVETRWGPVSLAVCYDLRFPEMFCLVREKGAELVIMASGWPLKRVEHWKTLIRARAIENQTFFAAVNCVGGDPAAPFGGASAVIGPWGDVLAEAGSQEEDMLLAHVDLTEAGRVRRDYPFFDDRLPHYST